MINLKESLKINYKNQIDYNYKGSYTVRQKWLAYTYVPWLETQIDRINRLIDEGEIVYKPHPGHQHYGPLGLNDNYEGLVIGVRPIQQKEDMRCDKCGK